MIVNASVVLRRYFSAKTNKQSRGATKTEQFKTRSLELLSLTRSMRLSEAHTQLYSLEEEIKKNYTHAYSSFLKNKSLVEYHFRRYGVVEMALLNLIAYNNFGFVPEANKEHRHKLTLLYMVYQPHKLEESVGLMRKEIKDNSAEWDWNIKYYQALTKLYADKPVEARRGLLQLTNSLLEQGKISALQSKKMNYAVQCVVALLVMKLLYPTTEQEGSERASRIAFKELMKGNPISEAMLEEASTIDLANCLLSYEKNEQVSFDSLQPADLPPCYLKLTRLLCERFIREGNHAKAEQYARFTEPDHIHRNFLTAVRLYDEKKFEAARDHIIQSIFDRENQHLPETDGLRYDAYKLLELTMKSLNPKHAEEAGYEAELFRLTHNLDLSTRFIHSFNVPLRKMFSLDNFVG